MEILILFGIGCLLCWAVGHLLGTHVPEDSARRKSIDELGNEKFQIRVSTNNLDLNDGFKDQCFLIEATGLIHANSDNHLVRNVIRIDEIAPSIRPVFSTENDWHEPETSMACFALETKLPYANSMISGWMNFGYFPIGCLVFSRRGLLTLEFIAEVVSKSTGECLEQATATVDFRNSELGYIDGAEARDLEKESAVKLAILLSACDGEKDKTEGDIIKEWINEQLERCGSEEKREQLRNKLNKAVEQVFNLRGVSVVRSKFIEIAKTVSQNADNAGRYAIMELLLKIAKADGIAAGAELSLLEKGSEILNLDTHKFRHLRDKELPISMHKSDDLQIENSDDNLLGITKIMSSDEVRTHLTREYRKWNSRTDHTDAVVRKQAREMIKIIAAARHRHLKGR